MEACAAATPVREDERLLKAVFDLLPVGVWIADATGRIVSNNPAGERIWGGARPVPMAQSGEHRGWWVDSGKPIAPDEWGMARALRQGQTATGELVRIQCFDGSFKTVINWAAPIRSDAGQITGAVAVDEDITALQQAQEQLRTAVRDREDILAVVAHDLRNPLTALALLAETARSKAGRLPGGEELQAAAGEIAQITREMSGLVNDLLAIAVEGPGRSMLKTAPVRPASLLVTAAAAAQPLFARAGIQLVVEPGGELPDVHADRPRILRVFANLFDNALKFTQAPGRAVVRAQALSGSVRFSVANSGAPLRQEERDRMLQPFWQADRDDVRGAGLGLSICRSIVEAHGGSIWAEPAEGMQVQISFALPCVNPAAAGAP